jgi:para-aminobenzoate synthetase component 1
MSASEAARLARSISGPCAVVHDGPRVILASDPDEVIVASGDDAFRALDRLDDGFWCGWMTYNLGRTAVGITPRSEHADLVLLRFTKQLAIDPPSTLAAAPPSTAPTAPASDDHRHPAWKSNLSPTTWTHAVHAIHEHERAGDCYQVNLTRMLHTEAHLDPRTLFHYLTHANPAPHGALVDARDAVGRSVVSASPERFLSRHGDTVVTQPIKGTDADAARLAASAKDHTENTMIVDLARNDLGRVCEYGSVQVPDLCRVEHHPGLVHLVSTVTGTLRADTGYGALFRATMPAASITGAPKHRVMQIIDALEPDDRGIYCGSVGWIDTARDRADWNVAIRTFEIGHDGTRFGVGAGITIESDPAAEWAETELKAHRLIAAASNCLPVSS